MTAQGSKAIARFNSDSSAFDLVLGTGQEMTHLIWVSPDGKTICTTNVESGTLSIFENRLVQPSIPPTGVLPPGAKPRMDWIQTLVPVGKGAEGFDVTPSGREFWTARPDGKLAIVDIASKRLTDTLDIKLEGAHRMKFTPDGKRVLIVSVKTGELVAIDVANRREMQRVTTGHGAGMLMDPLGNRVFISCTPDHYVAILDLSTLKETGRLEIGGRPDGMAWAEF